jgi:NADH-quinone oxidoreductase subunit J
MSLSAAVFYIAAAISIVATGAVLLARNMVNAVLYLLVSLFAVALMFYALGGAFVALLEIIVYAGAIVVLFLFVIMMLNISKIEEQTDVKPPTPAQLLLPCLFALILAVDVGIAIYAGAIGTVGARAITAADIGRVLYREHYLGVELASIILLIGLIGGMLFGTQAWEPDKKEDKSRDSL